MQTIKRLPPSSVEYGKFAPRTKTTPFRTLMCGKSSPCAERCGISKFRLMTIHSLTRVFLSWQFDNGNTTLMFHARWVLYICCMGYGVRIDRIQEVCVNRNPVWGVSIYWEECLWWCAIEGCWWCYYCCYIAGRGSTPQHQYQHVFNFTDSQTERKLSDTITSFIHTWT